MSDLTVILLLYFYLLLKAIVIITNIIANINIPNVNAIPSPLAFESKPVPFALFTNLN